jgi:hypothetical protein
VLDGLAVLLWARRKRPGAPIVSVLREGDIAFSRDAEILRDQVLKFVFEYLPVAVNDEATLDEVEHRTSPRPLLILGAAYDVRQAVRGESDSPAFPEIIMAMGTCDAVTIFLSVG